MHKFEPHKSKSFSSIFVYRTFLISAYLFVLNFQFMHIILLFTYVRPFSGKFKRLHSQQ